MKKKIKIILFWIVIIPTFTFVGVLTASDSRDKEPGSILIAFFKVVSKFEAWAFEMEPRRT